MINQSRKKDQIVFILSVESDITKSSWDEEVIKKYATQETKEKKS